MLVDGSLAHSEKLRRLGLAEATKESVLHECLRDDGVLEEPEVVDEQSSVPAASGEICIAGVFIAHDAQYSGTHRKPQYRDTGIPDEVR